MAGERGPLEALAVLAPKGEVLAHTDRNTLRRVGLTIA
jgi:hypothetical protein